MYGHSTRRRWNSRSIKKVLVASSILLLVISTLVCIASYNADATEMDVSEARADGPIYDLPTQFKQQVVVDRDNKEYILIWYENRYGKVEALDFEPLLDFDGNNVVMDQA